MSEHLVSSQHQLMSSSSMDSDRHYLRINDMLLDGIVGPLLVAYLVYAVLFATLPYSISVDASDSIMTLFKNKFDGRGGLSRVTPWDVWTNIVFFVPFGLLLILQPFVFRKAWYTRLFLTTCAAALLSAGIEAIQLFFPRAPSLEDIVCNTIGGLVGGTIGVCAQVIFQTDAAAWLRRLRLSTTLAVLMTGYLMFLLATVSRPLPLPRDLSNWDKDYPLLLGNEGSLDRPWRGTMYLVALYDRALVPEEVERNFSAGHSVVSPKKRAEHGLILYYDFSENGGDVVHDQASGHAPINLHIEDPRQVDWVTPNGIVLRAGAVISSTEPSEKSARGSISPRSELTVEAWVATAELAQTGPARIVSYSIDPHGRNFTLGQQNRDVVFRLRTPLSGGNGARPALMTSDSPLDLAAQHLVATYREGISTLYVNGREHAKMLLRSQDSMSDVVVRHIGKSFEWLVYSALIFPLGVLSNLLYRQQSVRWPRLFSLGTALAGLLFMQGYRMVNFDAPIDPLIILIGASTLIGTILLLPLSSYRPGACSR